MPAISPLNLVGYKKYLLHTFTRYLQMNTFII